MCCSAGGLTAVEMGGGVGGENMCEDLRSGSGNIGMCIRLAPFSPLCSLPTALKELVAQLLSVSCESETVSF